MKTPLFYQEVSDSRSLQTKIFFPLKTCDGIKNLQKLVLKEDVLSEECRLPSYYLALQDCEINILSNNYSPMLLCVCDSMNLQYVLKILFIYFKQERILDMLDCCLVLHPLAGSTMVDTFLSRAKERGIEIQYKSFDFSLEIKN